MGSDDAIARAIDRVNAKYDRRLRIIRLAELIMWAVLIVAVFASMRCYPRPPNPVPSCAQDPRQPWCAQVAADGGRG